MSYLRVNANWHHTRVRFAFFIILFAFAIIFFRLFYLQIINGKTYKIKSEKNCIRKQKLFAARGDIFDKNGLFIVSNRPSFELSIILEDAKPYKETIHKLSLYTGLPEVELLDIIAKKRIRRKAYGKIVLNDDIDIRTLSIVENNKLDLPGVKIDISPVRYYKDSYLAPHLLGYVGIISPEELKEKKGMDINAIIGKAGLEKQEDALLRGKKGEIEFEVDVKGEIVRKIKTVNPVSGADIHLTIDAKLQAKSNELMGDNPGAVIVMNPKSGEILTLASYPSFDLNKLSGFMSHSKWQKLIKDKNRPMFNKPVQGLYPPASIYKIVLAIAALEEGVIDENFLVVCRGSKIYGKRKFKCWKQEGHGVVNIVDALTESCDIFFYEVGKRLGVNKIAKYAKLLGFGEITGIDIEGENEGLVPTKAWKKAVKKKSWYLGDTISVSIGQGYNLATPIQMLSLISAIANDGVFVKPTIVKSIVGKDGKVLFQNSYSQKNIKLKPKTINILKKSLWRVVNSPKGTAYSYRTPFNISGKTGTAQVVSNDNNQIKAKRHLFAHSSFVAYAPSKGEPEVAIYVVVEHGEYRNVKAAEIAMKLIGYYFSLKNETD